MFFGLFKLFHFAFLRLVVPVTEALRTEMRMVRHAAFHVHRFMLVRRPEQDDYG